MGDNVSYSTANTELWVETGVDTGIFELNVGTVSPSDGPLTVTFVVTVDDPLADGQTETVNNVSIVGDEDTTPDTSTDTSPLDAAPVLEVEKSDGDATGIPGVYIT